MEHESRFENMFTVIFRTGFLHLAEGHNSAGSRFSNKAVPAFLCLCDIFLCVTFFFLYWESNERFTIIAFTFTSKKTLRGEVRNCNLPQRHLTTNDETLALSIVLQLS